MGSIRNIAIIYFFLILVSFQSVQIFEGTGTVSFISEAPLETIKAKSDNLRGLLDLNKKTFAFSLQVNTFEGFNSVLQKEHFNEHYMETSKIPKATFTGSLIGNFDCEDDCDLELFAKGKMTIHGITQIVILPIQFTKNKKSISAKSNFDIKLDDYDISIPKILDAKISPVIQVNVLVNFN